MKILQGRQAQDFTDAADLAIWEARVHDMSVDIIDVFTSIVDTDKVSSEANKAIATNIRNRYGGKATWREERWFVPIPRLHYEGKDMPLLTIVVTIYLVAAALVRTAQDSRWVTVLGVVGGKPEPLTIPIVFLHAILMEDMARFAIVARDANDTTWDVPGAKLVRLPNGFVSDITEMLKSQSVATWLSEFGAQGRCVAPLVVGSLLGLMFQNSAQRSSAYHEMVSTESLVSALEGMAYNSTEAREMVMRAGPRLRADMALEEAIRLVLQTGQIGE